MTGLQCLLKQCNTLQQTATHCNTRQHTTTHCNTLQHTATHCIMAVDDGPSVPTQTMQHILWNMKWIDPLLSWGPTIHLGVYVARCILLIPPLRWVCGWRRVGEGVWVSVRVWVGCLTWACRCGHVCAGRACASMWKLCACARVGVWEVHTRRCVSSDSAHSWLFAGKQRRNGPVAFWAKFENNRASLNKV